MFRIKTFNKISQLGLQKLDPKRYDVSDSVDNPQAILLRSYNLQNETFDSDLLAIGRAGAGTNNIPVDACSEQGIVVFNTPGANANAVKELVIAGLLMATRNILDGIDYTRSIKDEGAAISELVEKQKASFKGIELRGRKFGVVGLGAIGLMVANTSAALGLEVQGHDPFISVQRAWMLSRAVSPVEQLDSLLATSDFVTLHMPLTGKTRELINRDRLRQMKKGAVLLNFARPEIVNVPDILAALDDGSLRRYVTDFPDERLLNSPKVICIPHLGASTKEAEENCSLMVVHQMREFLEKGSIVNSVNFPDCVVERSGQLRLCIMNKNIPNVISQMTAAIGKRGHNIQDMINKSRGDLAYSILDLDTPSLSEEDLAALRSVKGVMRLRVIPAGNESA